MFSSSPPICRRLGNTIPQVSDWTGVESSLLQCYYRAKALTIIPPLNETENCSVKFYIPLKQSPLHDNDYVCYNFSVAHVPTNVYDLSNKLQRVGNWTTGLDEVFKLNAKSDPTLKWQYFGSSTGFFKYYPGKSIERVRTCMCVIN
ncbi:unnamed protein product [Trichobilharzia regenti]|nr:unnamed protein product [Trichobilharzia regenti]